MLELMHQVPLFAWLPEEGAETLSNCFDLCVEELNAGETRATEGPYRLPAPGRRGLPDGRWHPYLGAGGCVRPRTGQKPAPRRPGGGRGLYRGLVPR